MTNDSPYQPAPTPTPASRMSLGLLSLLIGGGFIALGFLYNIMQAAVVASGNYNILGFLGGAYGVLSFLGGLAALVLGGVVLLRRGESRVAAAAGAAFGAALVLGAVGSWLYSGILMLFSW